METNTGFITALSIVKFQKDLIVWKPEGIRQHVIYIVWFQKDLIVWKHFRVYDTDLIEEGFRRT